jgi:hypothetical protein
MLQNALLLFKELFSLLEADFKCTTSVGTLTHIVEPNMEGFFSPELHMLMNFRGLGQKSAFGGST